MQNQYDVMVIAEGAPADQLSAAEGKFRLVLESKLGGATRVRECFLASAKQTREGHGALFPQEVLDANAFQSASLDAEAAAKQMLYRQDIGFLVTLGQPASPLKQRRIIRPTTNGPIGVRCVM